jgi:hypothetical protein
MFYRCIFCCLMLFMLISCGNDDKALFLPPAVNLNNKAITNNVSDSDIGGTNNNKNNELTDNDLDDSDIGRTNTDPNEDNGLTESDIDDSDPVV